MKNRLFVNNNTIILFLFIIGSFLFIELNFRYWYRFLEQYMMFQTTGSYFQDRLAEPGGLNEYVTEFLSLAFIHPYGASGSDRFIIRTDLRLFFPLLKSLWGACLYVGGYSSLFFNLDLSAGVNRLVDDARFRAGSCVFVYFNQD